jgi:hypothetical protein
LRGCWGVKFCKGALMVLFGAELRILTTDCPPQEEKLASSFCDKTRSFSMYFATGF